MLSQLQRLSTETDGRYATDAELAFFQAYLKTARLRFGLYQKLQILEPQIVQQVLARLQLENPGLLRVENTDMTAKWQRDTVRTLRYAATTLLIDDPDIFKERMLLWFQTIMRSFGAERSCYETYKVMAAIVQQHFTPEEANLLCPLLDLSQTVLGRLGPIS